MRWFLALLAVILGVSLPQLGSAEELRVILPAEAFRGSSVSDLHPRATGFWRPTLEDVERMEIMLQGFLLQEAKDANRAKQKDIQLILENFASERRQYVGLIIEGKRLLHVNFFPKWMPDNSPDWENRYVSVYDGGPLYWRVNFRCDDFKFMNFGYNG